MANLNKDTSGGVPSIRSKLVVRCLPYNITTETLNDVFGRFASQLEYLHLVTGKKSAKKEIDSLAYVRLPPQEIIPFHTAIHGHSIVAPNGKEYRLVVEYAYNQAYPTDTTSEDPLAGTIEEDADYKRFVDMLQTPSQSAARTDDQLNRPQESLLPHSVTTPLVEAIKAKEKRRRRDGSQKAQSKQVADGSAPKSKSGKRRERRRRRNGNPRKRTGIPEGAPPASSPTSSSQVASTAAASDATKMASHRQVRRRRRGPRPGGPSESSGGGNGTGGFQIQRPGPRDTSS